MAFKGLPEDYCLKEVINRFCQGCRDPEAGKYACLGAPETMEEALNSIRTFQYISQAVDVKHKKRAEPAVHAVNAVQQEKEPAWLKTIEKLVEKVDQLVQVNTQQRSQLSLPRQSAPRKAEATEKRGPLCFFCKEKGHFKKKCPDYKKWVEKKVLTA